MYSDIENIDLEELRALCYKLEEKVGARVRSSSKAGLLTAFYDALSRLEDNEKAAFLNENSLNFDTTGEGVSNDRGVRAATVKTHALYPSVLFHDVIFEPTDYILNNFPLAFIRFKDALALAKGGARIVYDEKFTKLNKAKLDELIKS